SISQNEYYRFSLWYRSSISGHKILVAINQYDNNGNWISGNNIDMPLVADTEWRFFQVIIRTFNPKTAMIRMNLYATLWTDRGDLTGDAFYDEVIFEKVTISDMTYGSYLMSDADISVWQSPVTQKVQKNMKPSGENTVDKAIFYTAKGEYEALQIVVTPAKDITLSNITVSDFISEKGRLNVQTLKVYIARFVNITQPTDISSLKGEVPDPLVEPDFPVNIKANQSQPFYIVIKIPEEATPGLYESKIRFILSNGTEKEIKAALRIWDFKIPKRHSLRTAFGFNYTNLDFYHNLQGSYEDLRNVAELYIKDMAEHRISPIDPFLDDYYSLTITLTGFIGGKVVTDGVTSNHFIEVDDNSPTECINAYFYKKIKIERDADYYLSWKAKGNVGSDYLVAINQFDSNQNWISGANLDFVRSSNGDWNSESVNIDRNQIRSNTEYIGVRLYARKWTLSCELMGKTVFDDIILRKIGTNENLIFNGNFESEISDALVDVDFSKFDKRAEYVFNTLNFDSFSLRLYNFAGGDWTGQYT
ncbi:MAG: hypothetical protein N3B13_10490, partial [Deltaproteobacteria bacterium]|nr:hypothetical protein [Deltaproteobacteria bacterium]